MESESKVARYGNSLTVRLPVAIARELDIREGDRITLQTTGEGIFIARPRRSRLAARIATVREPEYELGAGRAVGAESLD